MTQKWNLGDIRPARPERGERVPAQPDSTTSVPIRRSSVDIAPRRPTQQQVPPRRDHVPPPPLREPDVEMLDIIDGNASRTKRIIVAVSICLLIIGSAITLNVLMGGAEVTVVPKFRNVSVQATFTAEKTPKAGSLSYELLTLEATGERQVSAKGTEKVSERAAGKIFVYNTDEKSTQRLIKNTRFENPDGLIFRIKESVEVPKATKDAKGALVPGATTADVFADGTGEQYNVAPSRFTVPGLKGTPQFATVYGEATVPFGGGFEGEKYLIDEAELETKKQELHLELRNSLLERLKTERPSGFIAYDDAVTFTYETLPSTAYGESLATIKEHVRLHVPLFKEAEFASYIAKNTVAGYTGESVLITNPHVLTFSYDGATTSQSDISDDASLSFMLKGAPQIVWQYDTEKLKSDLAGTDKASLGSTLKGYPAIDRAEAVIRPFWVQSFPENTKEISITTQELGANPQPQDQKSATTE